jgi:hypothetical protein
LAPFTQVHSPFGRPLDITRFADDPVFTEVPAVGLSLITSPEGTVLLEAVVTVPTTNPTPVIAVDAAVCVSFNTFGTITCVTCAGPLEITRFTDDPVFTDVPATGLSLITSPEGTVLLDAVVTVPTTSPAPVIAVDAAVCVSFTTFGTDTCAPPLDVPFSVTRPMFQFAYRKPIVAEYDPVVDTIWYSTPNSGPVPTVPPVGIV